MLPQLVLFAILCASSSGFKLPWVGHKARVVPRQEPVVQNSEFSSKGPVLTLTEPNTQTRVHLVGVAHGSSSSAELVDDVIAKLNPSNVVLELCDERFLSISLDARVRPRNNESMTSWFDGKVRIIDEEDRLKSTNALKYSLNRTAQVARWISAQGFVAGVFVLMGLAVASLQKAARSGSKVKMSDEFVTAIRAAERQNIELTLGDAPQADTLNSVKRVFTRDLFDVEQIAEGTKLLWFSMLGVGPYHSNVKLGSTMERRLLDESQWLNIPRAYLTNRTMLQGLFPLLLLSTSATLVTMALKEAGAATDTVDPSALALDAAVDGSFPTLGLASSFFSVLFSDLPLPVEQFVDTSIDALGILVLIRLARLIGTDRDAILAKSIQDACRRHKGEEIVVVIGMLHANGVARWLLSGKDPENF